MAVDEAVFQHLGHDALVEAGGVQVGGLLGLQQLGVQRLGGHQVAQAQAGGQDFAERAEVERALGVARGQRGGRGCVKPQVAVGVVFDDGQARVGGGLGHGGAAGFGHGAARGVLEVGQQVHEAGGIGTAASLDAQVGGIHAFVVAGHADHGGLHRGVGLQRAQVGGGFDQDAAARVDQDFGHQIQALLRAGGDEHLVGADIHALFFQVMRHPVAQRAIAFAGGVLQGAAAILGQHFLGGFQHGIDGEGLGRRQATGKADDAGLFGHFQDFADDRGVHLVGALCQFPAHVCAPYVVAVSCVWVS